MVDMREEEENLRRARREAIAPYEYDNEGKYDNGICGSRGYMRHTSRWGKDRG